MWDTPIFKDFTKLVRIAGNKSEVIKKEFIQSDDEEIPGELNYTKKVINVPILPENIVPDFEVNVTEEDEPVVQRAQSSVKKYNTPKPNRRPKVKSKSQIQFGEMGRYLKTTRMNRVNFDFPKTLNFRSKSAEKIESPEKLSYDFIGKGNRNFL